MSARRVATDGMGDGTAASRILLTVSGTIPPDVEEQVRRGTRPRPDYLELSRTMCADLLDVPEARRRGGWFGRLLERVGGPGLLLGWTCFRERRSYDTIVTDGEQVGLPLALLSGFTRRRSCTHVMIVHILSVRKKVLLYRLLRLGRRIDLMLVYSSAQQRFISEELGFPANRVVLTPFMVDTDFFSSAHTTAEPSRMICTAGLEMRDYPTLIEAVRGVDVRVVIAAASPWSKRRDTTEGADLPENVEVCSLGFVDLRQLYADASLVVMPLYDVEFQAGVTTILEAMAMRKTVICSRTRGQTDTIVDGETGVFVGPRNSLELRHVITQLLDNPARAARLGAEAREYVVSACDVSVYARRLAQLVEGTQGRET